MPRYVAINVLRCEVRVKIRPKTSAEVYVCTHVERPDGIFEKILLALKNTNDSLLKMEWNILLFKKIQEWCYKL